MSTLEAIAVKQEKVSPREYLRMYRENPSNIDAVRVMPPRLGSKGFGSVWVSYKSPIYKVPNLGRK